MKQKTKKKLSIGLVCVLCALLLVVFNTCSDTGKNEQTNRHQGTEPGDQTTTPGPGNDKEMENNPFLSDFDTPYGVPPFDKIKEEHYIPAFKEGIKQEEQEIEAIANNPETATFENTIEALDRSGALLNKVDNIFSALKSANANEKMQKIAKKTATMMAKHGDDITFNEKLFQRIKAVYEKKDHLKLSTEQHKLLDDIYKDFVRRGANLTAEEKDRLRKINEELSVLEVKFAGNVVSENSAFKLVIENPEDLAGLPETVITGAAETAKQLDQEGKWVFTLDKPSMIPFLQYSTKRDLREKIFTAYISRGNNNNEFDNKKIISQIVNLRLEKAKLLGFPTYAAYQLERNMAKTQARVYNFLGDLWKTARAMAVNEAADMQAIIDKEGGDFKLQPWDWWYYAEKVKKQKFDVDDTILKPYFQLENVMNGAFYLANRLYGLQFIEKTGVPKYHEDVRVFEVQEADGSHTGILYVDYYPRATKKVGAWMNSFREQSFRDGKKVYAVVTNNGNFARPAGDTPSLLRQEEVESLFHEFGHALHGLLSNVSYEKLSGTGVPIDFVELPSQIMENWVFEPELLKVYAKHYRTGEVIPQHVIDKINNSRLFNEGFKTVEYLAAAFLDMDWYSITGAKEYDVEAFESASMQKIKLVPQIVSRYRSTFFNHIFASMYSAGYYSYIWAEVLDADAYEAFKESGNIFDKKTAESFRKNVLEKGGSAEPMQLYKNFRGAEPNIAPLLKRRFGISK